ncbi:MAG: histidine phosphatase family protein [Candidatus Omnitrophota bacterium]
MLTTLYLIRHGITKLNKKKMYCGKIGAPLSSQGKRQSAKLAKRLKSVDFDRVYSSSKKRALQTARIIFKNERITRVNGLSEVNFGVMEGLTYSQILEKYPDAYKKWLKNPYCNCIPKAEGLDAFGKRIEKTIAKIIKGNKGKTIAVVCHGGTISIFITVILKNKKFWDYIPKPASFSIVEYKKDKPSIKLFNNTA